MDKYLKKILFDAAKESPGSWYWEAITLKAAADRLHPIHLPEREDEPSFNATHSFLLGLAFETLLKGIITMVRLERGETPALDARHLIHHLERLAILPECAELGFTADEISVLCRLTPYVIWAGRYPFPRTEAEMIGMGWSGKGYIEEEDLWNKLEPVLKARGWIQKMGAAGKPGPKLYLTPRPTTSA